MFLRLILLNKFKFSILPIYLSYSCEKRNIGIPKGKNMVILDSFINTLCILVTVLYNGIKLMIKM